MWWLDTRLFAEFTATDGVDHPGLVAVEASENPAFPTSDDVVAGLVLPK
jgi:hypothetical protein